MHARAKLPAALDELLRSDLEQAIYEANLGIDDTEIAKRYLIRQMPQIDIAAELGCDRSTISKRMPQILRKVQRAAEKLFGTRLSHKNMV